MVSNDSVSIESVFNDRIIYQNINKIKKKQI